MALTIEALEKIDLKTLKNLVALKQNRTLLELRDRRKKLARELETIDRRIESQLRRRPASRALLRALELGALPAGRGKQTAKKTARKRGAAAKKKTGGNGKRRPRGWVRERVTEVVKAARKPISPAAIRDQIVSSHPNQNEDSLYVSIFQVLRRGKEFKRTQKGWKLVR